MFKAYAIIVGLLVSCSTLAEKTLPLPTQDEFFKVRKEQYDQFIKDGRNVQVRQKFTQVCNEKIAIDSYCKCYSSVVAKQTDEFLYYDGIMSLDLSVAMQQAKRAGLAMDFKSLQRQSILRDGLNRRVALECGVIDDDMKVIPFNNPE